MKILIIDHESDLIKHITFCLQIRYSDLEVIVAHDTDSGMRLIESDFPDLVFLACSLPATDFASVIGEIREFSEVGRILIAGLETTALERAEYMVGCRRHSATKP